MTDVTIDKDSLSDQAYGYIKAQILAGALKGGERIPEEGIAELLGVSRTPIREAIKRLEEYGLVKTKPRSYAEVVSIGPSDAVQINQVRSSLEELAVSLLATSGTKDDYDVLHEMVNSIDEAFAEGDIARTFMLDSHFHLEICKRSRNDHLYELFQKADAKVQLARVEIHLTTSVLATFLEHHSQLIEALRARNEIRSVSIMRTHIRDQLNYLKWNPDSDSQSTGR